MVEITLNTYLIVLPLIFFAGLVDAIAGGGGLISLPAYFAAGLPPHFALGNNKFSSVFGTTLTTVKYYRNNMIDVKFAVTAAAAALIGSFSGTNLVLILDPFFLNYLLIIAIPIVAVFSLRHKELGKVSEFHVNSPGRKVVIALLTGFIVGFWDGFFGPGTGSFIVLIFTVFLKMDFVSANANAKVINLCSNLAAIITYLLHGKVIFAIGIPAVVFGMAGNYVGSHFVIKKGRKIIFPVFISVLVLLLVKVLYDVLKDSGII